MSLPEELQSVINLALDEMRSDLHHRLTPARRRTIYSAFGSRTNEDVQRSLGWLGVLASKQVLPIFQQVFPEDTFPQELLGTAIGLLEGRIDKKVANIMLERAYHDSGNYWNYSEDEMPWNANLAAKTTYHAVMEAQGIEPLSNLQHYAIVQVVTESILQGDRPSSSFIYITRPDSNYVIPFTGDQWTDEDVCEVVSSDTAACATVASACYTDGPTCDPEKLQEFWIWWLTEAIPEAWNIGHKDELSKGNKRLW